MDPQNYDVIIVGAGLSGIIAARHYLEIHPNYKLAILEKDKCVGGVFSSRRLYDHFWTQWSVGTAEFSDMPMDRPPPEDCYHDFFNAKYTGQYLEKYVDQKSFAGRSLRERIIFGVEVQSVKKIDGEWVLSCTNAAKEAQIFSSAKLMVASGLTSTPNMPSLPGRQNFKGTVLHQEDFGQSGVLSSADIKNVTVIGGAKSAADMVYAAVKAGKNVSWIVRTTGVGPGFFASVKGMGPYKNAFEVGSTRLAAMLTPSLLNKDNWLTKFLHETGVGNRLVNVMWSGIDKDTRKDANLTGRKGAKKGLEKMSHHTPIFWQNGSGGLLNHEDFWDVVAKNVDIYDGEIRELDTEVIRLTGGEEIPCDALLCGTGWSPSLDFFDKDLLVKLDFPHLLEDEPEESVEKWAQLLKEADQKIIRKFPMLANPPVHYHKQLKTTPYRLYNGMASLHDNSILLINYIVAGNKFLAAEVQAIWAIAYLDGKLSLPSLEAQEAEIALCLAWDRRRYLSNGEPGNFLTFESVTYADKLLNELGFSSHRKGRYRDIFEPFRPRDLLPVQAEYIAKYGKD